MEILVAKGSVKRIGVHVVLTTADGRQHFLKAHEAKAMGEALVAVSSETPQK